MMRIPVSLLVLGTLASGAHAGTRYVNAALASGANDGTSWADAYQGSAGVQAALTAAVAGDQIWVAQGVYEPTSLATRSIYFNLKNGVELYGGFAGFETALGQRDFIANVTTLTGDLNGDDGSSVFTDNSYHVLNAGTTNATAVADGFTVTGGNANGVSGNQDRGGGILCVGGGSPTLRNCIFVANRCSFGGGAGYINSSSPSFTDCRFESNLGGSYGGAFDMATSVAATFTRCVFVSNSAARAGGVEIFGSSTTKLTNCLFWNNTSTGSGGGGAIFVSSSAPTIRNCTIVGNKSNVHATGGILGASTIANCIVYFNQGPGGAMGLVNNVSAVAATYSCVQGGLAGTGNQSGDPLLVNLAGGNAHLLPSSLCSDAGNNASVPAGTTTDLDGNPRFADNASVADTGSGFAPFVDLGAYEVPNQLYASFCVGDGSLATPCPCANNGQLGHGCAHSELGSIGALLVASGTASPDTVVLHASDLLPTVTCVFLQGNAIVSAGAVFGDGVRCVGGSLKRLYIKSASSGLASAPTGVELSITARSAALGDTIASGTDRYYQVYYRDPDLTWCANPPGNSWNVTNGVILHW